MKIREHSFFDGIDERIAMMEADIALLGKEGHNTACLERSIAALRKQVVVATKHESDDTRAT